jgi:ABC-2 type transport system ATP-binding protein
MKMIQIEGLTKDFGALRVLDEINLEVERGEVFGFLGPNGAGKTTTLRLLLGLLRPTSGRALVFGQDLGGDERLRRRVGVLLENDGLYARLSAYDNLEYYARLYEVADHGRRTQELLEFVGLGQWRDERVGNLSTGMRRKLGLARALIHEPEALFFDEPTSGLDPEAQKMIRDLIVRLSGGEGTTVFLNSHHLDEVQRVCTRVAILHQGRIRASDSVENLRRPEAGPALEIELTRPEQAGEACQVLSEAGLVSSCQVRDGTVVANLAGASSSPVISLLVSRGIELEEVRKAEGSLEETYLRIVQKSEDGA